MNSLDYRKFLKNSNANTESLNDLMGENFPVSISVDEETIDLQSLMNFNSGNIVIFISEQCASCDLQPIINFSSLYDRFNYLIFYESEKKLDEKIFGNHVQLIPIRMEIVNELFGVSIIPSALFLNNKGQIISTGIFNSEEDLERLSFHLLKVYYEPKGTN